MSQIDSAIGVAPAPRPKPPKGRRILGFVVGGVWLLLTVPALGLAAMSVMASDGGVNAAIYTFVYACFALPLTTLLATAGGVVTGVTGKRRFVAIGSALPFLALLVAVVAIAAGAEAPKT